MYKLFGDLKTDEEKSNFFLSGRGYETGVIAAAIQTDVAMAYHRCAEYKKELAALQAENDRLTRYYKNGIDCFANPCERHSGERTSPFSEFFERYGGQCLSSPRRLPQRSKVISERIAYQCNRDHILKFAGMEKLTGEQVADELNRLYNTIAAQQQILNDLAEMMGVAEGDVDELIDAVDRLKEQHFTDLCNSADVKRLISAVAYPDNYADQDFSEMAKRVLAKMEQNIKALAGGEAGK